MKKIGDNELAEAIKNIKTFNNLSSVSKTVKDINLELLSSIEKFCPSERREAIIELGKLSKKLINFDKQMHEAIRDSKKIDKPINKLELSEKIVVKVDGKAVGSVNVKMPKDKIGGRNVKKKIG